MLHDPNNTATPTHIVNIISLPMAGGVSLDLSTEGELVGVVGGVPTDERWSRYYVVLNVVYYNNM